MSTSAPQPSWLYDPFLYAFMRACGAPREYYTRYCHEVGNRRPSRNPTLPLTDKTYAWATSKVRMMSLHYVTSPPTIEQAVRAVNNALDAIDAQPNAQGKALIGLNRRLLHAQAKHWAAIVAVAPDADPRQYARQRATSELVAEARAQRHADARLRYTEKLRRRKLRFAEAQHDFNQQAYAETCAAYDRARARFHLARNAHAQAQSEARAARGEAFAQAPKHLIAEMRAAHQEFARLRIARRKLKNALHNT